MSSEGSDKAVIAGTSRRVEMDKRAVLREGLFAAPLLVYGRSAGPNDIQVVHADIPLTAWPVGAEPLRIGFLSDLHCDSKHAVRRAAQAVALLMEQAPQLVLLGGDFISEHADPWSLLCAEALAPVAASPLGAFGVLGNHDWFGHGQDKVTDALRAQDIQILSNRSVPIRETEKVWLVGLDDYYYKKTRPDVALQGVPSDALKILLVHEPDAADRIDGDYAIQFSGHSHAGQVRLFGRAFVLPIYGRLYPMGLQQAQRHPVYTTRGIGTTGPELRVACRPEVTIATLRRATPV